MNTCKAFLKAYRRIVGAKKEERIDKRYKPFLAPNDKYYEAHCGYCAEVEYLQELYGDKDISDEELEKVLRRKK